MKYFTLQDTKGKPVKCRRTDDGRLQEWRPAYKRFGKTVPGEWFDVWEGSRKVS